MYLMRIGTNEHFPLDPWKNEFSVGRNINCDVRFTSPHVSRFHCVLERNVTAQNFLVRSTTSNNRTFVDAVTLSSNGDTATLLPDSILSLGIPLSLLDYNDNSNYIFLKLCCSEVRQDQTKNASSSNMERHSNAISKESVILQQDDSKSSTSVVSSNVSSVLCNNNNNNIKNNNNNNDKTTPLISQASNSGEKARLEEQIQNKDDCTIRASGAGHAIIHAASSAQTSDCIKICESDTLNNHVSAIGTSSPKALSNLSNKANLFTIEKLSNSKFSNDGNPNVSISSAHSALSNGLWNSNDKSIIEISDSEDDVDEVRPIKGAVMKGERNSRTPARPEASGFTVTSAEADVSVSSLKSKPDVQGAGVKKHLAHCDSRFQPGVQGNVSILATVSDNRDDVQVWNNSTEKSLLVNSSLEDDILSAVQLEVITDEVIDAGLKRKLVETVPCQNKKVLLCSASCNDIPDQEETAATLTSCKSTSTEKNPQITSKPVLISSMLNIQLQCNEELQKMEKSRKLIEKEAKLVEEELERMKEEDRLRKQKEDVIQLQLEHKRMELLKLEQQQVIIKNQVVVKSEPVDSDPSQDAHGPTPLNLISFIDQTASSLLSPSVPDKNCGLDNFNRNHNSLKDGSNLLKSCLPVAYTDGCTGSGDPCVIVSSASSQSVPNYHMKAKISPSTIFGIIERELILNKKMCSVQLERMSESYMRKFLASSNRMGTHNLDVSSLGNISTDAASSAPSNDFNSSKSTCINTTAARAYDNLISDVENKYSTCDGTNENDSGSNCDTDEANLGCMPLSVLNRVKAKRKQKRKLACEANKRISSHKRFHLETNTCASVPSCNDSVTDSSFPNAPTRDTAAVATDARSATGSQTATVATDARSATGSQTATVATDARSATGSQTATVATDARSATGSQTATVATDARSATGSQTATVATDARSATGSQTATVATDARSATGSQTATVATDARSATGSQTATVATDARSATGSQTATVATDARSATGSQTATVATDARSATGSPTDGESATLHQQSEEERTSLGYSTRLKNKEKIMQLHRIGEPVKNNYVVQEVNEHSGRIKMYISKIKKNKELDPTRNFVENNLLDIKKVEECMLNSFSVNASNINSSGLSKVTSHDASKGKPGFLPILESCHQSTKRELAKGDSSKRGLSIIDEIEHIDVMSASRGELEATNISGCTGGIPCAKLNNVFPVGESLVVPRKELPSQVDILRVKSPERALPRLKSHKAEETDITMQEPLEVEVLKSASSEIEKDFVMTTVMDFKVKSPQIQHLVISSNDIDIVRMKSPETVSKVKSQDTISVIKFPEYEVCSKPCDAPRSKAKLGKPALVTNNFPAVNHTKQSGIANISKQSDGNVHATNFHKKKLLKAKSNEVAELKSESCNSPVSKNGHKVAEKKTFIDYISDYEDDDLPDIDFPYMTSSTPMCATRPLSNTGLALTSPITCALPRYLDDGGVDQPGLSRQPAASSIYDQSRCAEGVRVCEDEMNSPDITNLNKHVLNVKVKIEKDADPYQLTGATSFVLPSAAIKREPGTSVEDDDRYVADDDEIQMIYSQMDDCILLSSDEDDLICSQDISSNSFNDSSFGPMPSSPEHNLGSLFRTYNEDCDTDEAACCTEPSTEVTKANADENKDNDAEILSKIPVSDWFPDLSQNFFDEDDNGEGGDHGDTEKCDSSSKDTMTTISLGANDVQLGASNEDVDLRDNLPNLLVPSSSSAVSDDLDTHEPLATVQKRMPVRTERSTKVIKAIIPEKKRRHSSKERGTTSDNRSYSSSRTVSSTSDRSSSTSRHTKRGSKYERSSRKSSSGNELRKHVTKSNNLKSCFADKKHTSSSPVPEAASSSSFRTSSSVRPQNVRTDHKVDLISIRNNENISVLKKPTSERRMVGIAKITKTNRSQKLIEVNLFGTPEISTCRSKSRITSAKDPPVVTAALTCVSTKTVPVASCTTYVDHAEHSPPSASSVPAQDNTNKIPEKETDGPLADSPPRETVIVQSTGSSCERELSDTVPVKQRLPGGILQMPGEKRRVPKLISFPESKENLEKIKLISPRKDRDKVGPANVKAKELSHKLQIDALSHKFQSMFTHVNNFYLNPYYFIHKVCSWNYDWLKLYHGGQSRSSNAKPPPLLGNKAMVFPTLILYDTFKDYHEVFSILLFYEVWENIYRDWKKFHTTNVWLKCEVDSVRHNQNPKDNLTVNKGLQHDNYNFTTVTLITLISRIQDAQGLYPRMGSLIAIKVPVQDKSTVLFAYVTQQMRYSRTMVSRALKEAIPDATTTVILTALLSKGSATQIKACSILNVSNVSYLKPNIRIWDGLTQLQRSPLGPYVLRPDIECIAPPAVTCEYTVSEVPLNECQTHAVCGISASVLNDALPRISLLHGPPGTGKTLTVVALVAQVVRLARQRGLRSRVLLCTPSNAAVDELTRRLLDLRGVGISINVVRIGRLANQNGQLKEFTVDHLVDQRLRQVVDSPGDERSRQELQRMMDTLAAARQDQDAATDGIQREQCRARVVELAKRKAQFQKDCRQHYTSAQLAELRTKITRDILLGADVVTSTLGSCCNETVSKALHREVSVCIIDEAGQCKETETWLPLLTGVCKLVLAGDHMQLPPTVLSQLAQGKNMKQSLFQRIYYHVVTELNRPELVHSLTIQYRMHPSIAHFPSAHFYRGTLQPGPDLRQARLSPFMPYVVMDIVDGREDSGSQPGDKKNLGEARLIATLLAAIAAQLHDRTVGVITPYQSQRQCLESHLSTWNKMNLIVNTIDAFQGQEKDVVFLSCVRDGRHNAGIGFLSAQERLNVALTRARFCLVIVGSVTSLAEHDAAWRALLRDAKTRGKVVSVWTAQLGDEALLRDRLMLR